MKTSLYIDQKKAEKQQAEQDTLEQEAYGSESKYDILSDEKEPKDEPLFEINKTAIFALVLVFIIGVV